MSDIKQIIKDIINGDITAEELQALTIALEEGKKIQGIRNAANFRIGTIVSISGMTPKELNQCEGEIVSFSKQRAKVDLRMTKTPPFGRFVTGKVYRGFPVVCLLEVDNDGARIRPVNATNFNNSALLDFLSS